MSITIRSAQTVSNGVKLRGDNTQYTISPAPDRLFELDASTYTSPLSTWQDISGNGRHATLHGTVPYYTDSVGGYFGFIGQGSNYIDIAGSESGWGIADNTPPNATLSIWANINQGGFYQHVAGWRGGYFHFYFLMLSDPLSNITEARVVNSVGSYDIMIPYDAYFNTWAYITLVADSNAGQSILYINSTQIGTANIGSDNWVSTNIPFRIGSADGGDFPLNGYIGGVTAYSRALTQEQVTSEFNRTKTRYGL
jgi:hypothetical protein